MVGEEAVSVLIYRSDDGEGKNGGIVEFQVMEFEQGEFLERRHRARCLLTHFIVLVPEKRAKATRYRAFILVYRGLILIPDMAIEGKLHAVPVIRSGSNFRIEKKNTIWHLFLL